MCSSDLVYLNIQLPMIREIFYLEAYRKETGEKTKEEIYRSCLLNCTFHLLLSCHSSPFFILSPSDRVCISLTILLSIHPSCYLVSWIALLLSERVFSLLCDSTYILHIMTLWIYSCTYIDRYHATYVRYFLLYYIQ